MKPPIYVCSTLELTTHHCHLPESDSLEFSASVSTLGFSKLPLHDILMVSNQKPQSQ